MPGVPPASTESRSGRAQSTEVIRTRGVDAGVAWWSQAWRIFVRAPVSWIVLVVVFIAISYALDFLLERWIVVNYAVSLLLGTVFVAAVLAVARSLHHVHPVTLGDVFAAFGNRFVPLIVLMTLVSVGFALCVLIGAGIVQLVFGSRVAQAWSWLVEAQQATTVEQLMAMMGRFDPQAPLIVLLVLLFGALLALPLLMAAWFAPALVLFHRDGPLTALKLSFIACLRNVAPFLAYGAVGLVLSIVATVPVLLGWIVLAPVMLITLYTSYDDVFAPTDAPAGKPGDKG